MTDLQKQELFAYMHNLLDAGLDLSRTFDVLLSGIGEAKVYSALKNAYRDIVQGKSLNESFSDTGEFDLLDVNVLKIGELSGTLSITCNFLVNYYTAKNRRKRIIKSALSYPIMIMAFSVVVLFFMLVVIVPTFSDVYSRMGGELPVLTKRLLDMSDRIPIYSGIFISVVIVILSLFCMKRKSAHVYRMKSQVLMSMPIIGRGVRLDAQNTFCMLMFVLLKSGFVVLDSLEMTVNSMRISHYRTVGYVILDEIKSGRMLSEILAKYPDMFCGKMIAMIRVGEESNNLPSMFSRASEMLSEDMEYYFKKITTYIEPIMVILVGTFVAFILISMYLPMFQMGSVIK